MPTTPAQAGVLVLRRGWGIAATAPYYPGRRVSSAPGICEIEACPCALRRPEGDDPRPAARHRPHGPLPVAVRRRHDALARGDQRALRRAAVRRRARDAAASRTRCSRGSPSSRTAGACCGRGTGSTTCAAALPAGAVPPAPAIEAGRGNDLNELFDLHLPRGAQVYAFGEPLGLTRGPVLRLRPRRGVHDVHQNQGNIARSGATTASGRTAACWCSARRRWTAILLRFQSQSWRTDDSTGHAR